MKLTTRIFRDLAVLANWAFQSAGCEPGAYKLAEVARNKNGKFNVDKYALQTSSLPECATWHDESEYIVKLSYNGGMQEYTFAIGNVFDLLARLKKIVVEDITAKEKSELCILNKKEKASGELLAVVEMPKSRTKQVAKAAAKNDDLHPQICGVYVDNSGYIVASDGKVLNACKIEGVFENDFAGAILPTEFAKRADGCTVEIYKDGDTVTAYCGEENEECINVRYPSWRAAMDSWGKICEKGHVKVKYADVKKAVGKDDAVTLSTYDGGVTISTYNQHNDPGVIYRHIQVEAEHGIDEFAISIDTENLKKVMPCCNDMYVADNKRPLYFIGDGCLSLVMPLDNENISHCDITRGETLVSAFDIMNGVTVCNDTSKKDIAAETVSTIEQTETNESVKHISEIIETCRLHDDETGEETDEYKYYKWLTSAHCGTYSNIADKALSESLAWIFVAAYRKGEGHIIAKNKYGVLIETIIATTPTETTDTDKEPDKQTESARTVITIAITGSIRQAIMQSVCEHLAAPRGQRSERLRHSGLLRRKTFRRLRVRRCSSVSRVVGGINGENAAERKETGKSTCWHGCKFRQFTRGSTLARGMNGITGGTNEIINKQYPGEMYCRGG